jgi:hypothetical protein
MAKVKLKPVDYGGPLYPHAPLKKSSNPKIHGTPLKAFMVEVDGEPIGIVREYEEVTHRKSGRLIMSSKYTYHWMPVTLERRIIKNLDYDGTKKGAVEALIKYVFKNGPE